MSGLIVRLTLLAVVPMVVGACAPPSPSSSHGSIKWLRRLGRRIPEKFEEANALVFHADAEWIMAGCESGRIVWWKPGGDALAPLATSGDAVRALGLDPKGKWLVSGHSVASDGRGGTLQLWDIEHGTKLRDLTPTGRVASCGAIATSPDGSWIVTANQSVLEVRDTKSWTVVSTCRGHEDGILDLEVGPDGLWIASCSLDHTVRLWDSVTGEQKLVLRGHEDIVYTVAASPNGALLASGARDRTIPTRYGRRLFEAAPDPKEMLVVDRANHNDLYDFPQVSERIIDFLQRHLPGGG
ncbi:MAG: hypothetical protein IH993_03400 [Proteobacteria bacterium]|nr:hypothetical protein [Pseudomonadota bacterium]